MNLEYMCLKLAMHFVYIILIKFVCFVHVAKTSYLSSSGSHPHTSNVYLFVQWRSKCQLEFNKDMNSSEIEAFKLNQRKACDDS